jgi:anthranilate synthase component 1
VIDTDAGRWVDPEAAFLALGDDGEDVVWLDSGLHAVSGMSLIGWPAPGGPRVTADNAVEALALLDVLGDAVARPGPGLLPAWVGWFAHEFGVALLGLPVEPGDEPLAELVLVERALVFDHGERTVRVVAPDTDAAWAEGVLRRLRGAPAEASDPPVASGRVGVLRAHDDAEYLELVRACQAHIAAGDAYQLCLTEQWSAPAPGSTADVYRRLRRLAPSHHAGLLRIGGIELLSASPERFVEVRDDVAVTRPMKGTRPRDADAAADAALAAELLASEKERAENLMIVDLVRNDLSKVSGLGTVTVEQLFAVESYRTMHQLVSTVTGRLGPGACAVDAFAALFPAGSMTGAPKRRAVELLAGLEGVRRGAYAGAFGYFAADGTADFATTIRTICVASGRASFGTGGGITAASDREAELVEMKLKAAALLAALGAV